MTTRNASHRSIHRTHRLVAATLLAALAALPSAGCIAASEDGEPVVGEAVDEAAMSWEEFLEQVYQEPDTGIYIVDGDVPITTLEELEAFYEEHVQQGALIVHRPGGVDAKWSATQKKVLTYCVSSAFGGNHAAVVSAMASAASAWEQSADVDFVYLPNQNGSCNSGNNNVVFDVSPTSGQPYLARAFFPNQTRPTRNVMIDASSFSVSPPLTLTGILRHELGHTLGFRHEHTRPEAGTCFEDSNWRALTTYDSASVMHYPQCNGTNSWALELSAKDRDGAASLYNKPGGAIVVDANNWTFHTANNPGYPVNSGTESVLLPDNRYSASAVVFYKTDVLPPYAVDFEYLTWDDDGGPIYSSADGVVLMIGKNRGAYGAPPAGGARGFIADGTGLGVHFATYGSRSVFLSNGWASPLVSTYNNATYTGGGWAKVRVEVNPGNVRVVFNGAEQFNWTGSLSTQYGGVALGAATGGADSEHRVRNVVVSVPNTCAHSTCAEGGTLTYACDSCAARICDVDPYCCNTYWDGICVSEVQSVCGQTCG